jgi:hypothetical protein
MGDDRDDNSLLDMCTDLIVWWQAFYRHSFFTKTDGCRPTSLSFLKKAPKYGTYDTGDLDFELFHRGDSARRCVRPKIELTPKAWLACTDGEVHAWRLGLL